MMRTSRTPSQSSGTSQPSSGRDSTLSPTSSQGDLIPSLMSLTIHPPHSVKPNYKMIIGTSDRQICPLNGMPLVTIRYNTEELLFGYNKNKGKLSSHTCDVCGPLSKESNLQPVYSVFHDQRYVIFARNQKAGTVDQYVFNSETRGLEQVKIDELVYQEGICYPFMAIGSEKESIQWEGKQWKKQQLTANGWVKIEPKPVITLKTLETADHSSDMLAEPMRTIFCQHFQRNILIVGSRVFRFNENEQRFDKVHHSACRNNSQISSDYSIEAIPGPLLSSLNQHHQLIIAEVASSSGIS
ncbi:Protein CBG22359 [Caenorhabditis briggsae]|uniref:Protein CBG22359 n=1 Tax=Caenorhabditis briggsae TaxID=6238 RepID=A8Y277_CAEBR|nr:Protein CBG22359 [Caenorhabditis briggsae]CAP38969.2 Protein CBG22359 [Caenorhabditis briggsae]